VNAKDVGADAIYWKWRWHFCYFTVCIALLFLWDGQFIFSDKLGIYDWKKELFYFDYLKLSLLKFHTLPVSFFSVPSEMLPPQGPPFKALMQSN
jgi:hypothetical protein